MFPLELLAIDGPEPRLAFILQLVFCFSMGWIGLKRYGYLAGMLLAYIAVSVTLMTSYPPVIMGPFAASAAMGFLTLLFYFSVVQLLDMRILLQILGIMNAIWIIFFNHHGLLYNPSRSGCLQAVIFPLYFGRGKVPLFSSLLIPLSIFMTDGASQPIALLFLAVGLFLLRRRKWLWITVSIVASLLIGHFLAGKDLFAPAGREQVWHQAMHFWFHNANYFIGMGTGSTYILAPKLIHVTNYGSHFINLHSDWLEILWELGIIGFLLTFFFFLSACVSAYKKEQVFIALVLYGAFGIANFPLHSPASAVVGAALIHEALKDEGAIALGEIRTLLGSFQASLQSFARRCRRSF